MNEVREETKSILNLENHNRAKPEKKIKPLSLDIPTEEEFKVEDEAWKSVRGPAPLNTFLFEE